MRHTTSKSLYDYWNRLRGDRLAPRRFEIEPMSIGDALPDTFILERHDSGNFPFRLAGTRLCERFKKEFRGHNFLASWSTEDGLALRTRLNTISVQGGVILILAEAETGSGSSVLVEFLILPLIHGQACADRFLGVFSPLETPQWLGFDPIQNVHILGSEIIWPDGHPRPLQAKTAEALDEAHDRQEPFLPRVRHARIVRSDRRQFRVFDGGLSNAPPVKQ